MKIREFIDQFVQGKPMVLTLRDPQGREFTADHVIVRAVSGPAPGYSLKNDPCTLELVLTGPELEM